MKGLKWVFCFYKNHTNTHAHISEMSATRRQRPQRRVWWECIYMIQFHAYTLNWMERRNDCSLHKNNAYKQYSTFLLQSVLSMYWCRLKCAAILSHFDIQRIHTYIGTPLAMSASGKKWVKTKLFESHRRWSVLYQNVEDWTLVWLYLCEHLHIICE